MEDHGCSKSAIGWLSATAIGVRVLTTPLVLQRAEVRRRRRRTLIVFALLGGLVMLPMKAATVFAALLGLHALVGLLHPPQIPLLDAMTLRAAMHDARFSYARIRTVGSIAFLATTLVVGRVLEHTAIDVVRLIIAAAFLCTAIAAAALPDVDAETDVVHADTPRESPLRALRGRRDFVQVLLCSGLIQGSHAAYYAYASVQWRSAGFDEQTIGMLWSEGVAAEILLFAFGARAAQRLGSRHLFRIGAAAAVLRWLTLGLTDSLAMVAVTQLLHAFSFGATHLGAMQWIQRNIPRRQAATAQGMLSAYSTGLTTAVATALSSVLYPAFGALPTFGTMALIAAGGALASARVNVPRAVA